MVEHTHARPGSWGLGRYSLAFTTIGAYFS